MTEMSPAEAIYFAALEKTTPEARAAYLDEACAGRPELRARVDRLLAAHPRVGSFLEGPALGDATQTVTPGPDETASAPVTTASEAPGGLVAGKYKLLQPIGEGGMGTVWMADQTHPVKRRVAVKLIRAERGQSRAILSRFEAERQAIALMDHPHIARLLDAGTTEAGAPFFVMELVKGVPITDYCDGHRLGIPERLKLFVQVCAAVQHAHQKGVIHRDLKPSNILVESHDGKPVPKVIDFGLAKATTGLQLTEHTLFTGFGTVLGTPLYMAPEQAAFNAVDVDTRADVYALGVVLYELLTGTTPITREAIRRAQLDEMLRLVREQEAPTPSSRLASTEGRPAVAANRAVEPDRLGRLVRGDLDWIAMKALAKERERRYETASGLARDVERFLNHEPVAAGPPTAGYKLRKFVRRNRPQVVAAGLLLLSLLAGIAGTTIGLVRAEQGRREAERARAAEAAERSKAEAAAEAESLAKLDAEARRQEAEANLAYARKGNEILGSVFAGLDPKKIAETGRPLQDVLRENLDLAVKELEGSALGDPLTVAAMQHTLGRSLLGLGEAEKAVTLFARARDTRAARLGPDDPHTLAAISDLAAAYRDAGRHGEALRLTEEVLTRMRAKLGPDHPNTMTGLGNLAVSYRAVGRPDKALPLFEEVLTRMRAKLGPDHPDTLRAINNLAEGYRDAGQPAKALHLSEEALALRKAKLGPDHPDTLVSMNSLAAAYWSAGRLDRSVPLFEELLPLQEMRLGRRHPDTQATAANLGVNYKDVGRLAEAIPLLEEAQAASRTHPRLRWVGVQLLDAYVKMGRREDGAKLAGELAAGAWESLPPGGPPRAGGLAFVGLFLLQLGAFAEAEPLLREALAIREQAEPEVWTTSNTRSLLGGALLGQQKYAEAEPLLIQGYEGLKAREAAIPPPGRVRIPEALDRLIALYTALEKPDEASKWQAERAKYPEADPPQGEQRK